MQAAVCVCVCDLVVVWCNTCVSLLQDGTAAQMHVDQMDTLGGADSVDAVQARLERQVAALNLQVHTRRMHLHPLPRLISCDVHLHSASG